LLVLACLATAVFGGLTALGTSRLDAATLMSSTSGIGAAPSTDPVSTSTAGPSVHDWALTQSDTPCLYSAEHISMLDEFGTLVHRSFQCAVVYNNASTTWASWDTPWFTEPVVADSDWDAWATAPGTHRTLIITQDLFPTSEDNADWLSLGASGAFEEYARRLASNLIKAGLGWSVIRLAHEANGDWYPDSVPDNPAGDRLWVKFWRNTAIAMRSVRGGHFTFDWSVNAGYRHVPLSSFYPGDDVVNYIGIDVYDAGLIGTTDRWQRIDGLPDGPAAIAAFARRHHKPLSLPEWGIGPAQQPAQHANGDDPAFINGFASFMAHHDVAYQAYFDGDLHGIQLFDSPRSTAAYIAHFGAYGNDVARAYRGRQTIPASGAPRLDVTAGPLNGATVMSGDVVFKFVVQARALVQCSLDQQPFRACSGSRRDVLQNLQPGFHSWLVQATDSSGRVAIEGRTFDVSSGGLRRRNQ
jgi:Glycosyl hydrolase family 26